MTAQERRQIHERLSTAPGYPGPAALEGWLAIAEAVSLARETCRERAYQNTQLNREKRKRIVTRKINPARARTAIGPITPGCEIFGVSKGQFSLVEIIEHILLEVGPSDLVVSTWTTGGADIEHFGFLMEEELILEARFLIDSSFPERQPEYCRMLIDRFGPHAITCTANHAKFVTITNPDWQISLRTSMNLNKNRRLETYEISDDPNMVRFLLDLAEAAFKDGFTVEQTLVNSDRAYKSVNNIMGRCAVPDRTIYTAPLGTKGQVSYATRHDKIEYRR